MRLRISPKRNGEDLGRFAALAEITDLQQQLVERELRGGVAAIGEHHDGANVVGIAFTLQVLVSLLHRVVEAGIAALGDAGNAAGDIGAFLAQRRERRERDDLVAEQRHFQPVAVIQPLDELQQTGARRVDLLAAHTAGYIHQHYQIYGLLRFFAPEALDSPHHFGRRDFEHRLRLAWIYAVLHIEGRGQRDGGICRAEAVGNGLQLLGSVEEETLEQLRRLALLRRYPGRIEDHVGVIAPEGALLGVDGDHGQLRHFARQSPALLRSDQVLVEHRRAEIRRPQLEHARGEEARALAVVDDAALHVAHKGDQVGISQILQREIALLARPGIGFGDDGEQAAITEVRMRVAELEIAPFRVAVSSPTLRRDCQRGDVGPAQRLVGPTQCFGHGAPHRHDDGA